jgi:7-cyano-7-deazaguanine synthase
MPQNLEETEYPGSALKCALLMRKPRTNEMVAIAPIYTPDQIQQCRLRGEQLGLKFIETAIIYSPVDLERVQGSSLPERPNPNHEPGCVFSNTEHPGTKCYVQDPNLGEVMPRGIAVVSGGLDSVTMLYDLLDHGDDIEVLSFDYGQRHVKELTQARQIVQGLGLQHHTIHMIDYGQTVASSGSSLVNFSTIVPEGSYDGENMKATVVPNRNMVMLSMAAGVAIASKAHYVATAVHAGDHAIYPDCRPDFTRKLQAAIRSGNEGFIDPNFIIWTPYIYNTKTDIARRAKELNVPVELTWSCYNGGKTHCGRCGTCVERLEALHDAGVEDKTVYLDTEFWKTAV